MFFGACVRHSQECLIWQVLGIYTSFKLLPQDVGLSASLHLAALSAAARRMTFVVISLAVTKSLSIFYLVVVMTFTGSL